jgi:hypothetical protein
MSAKRFLVALPALLCLACPGDWDEPLGPVSGGHIDAKLVGDWSCQGADEPVKFRLTIVPYDKDQYVMVTADLADKSAKPGYFRGFTTTVSGHDVMNVKELDENPSDGAWIYARFHFPQDGHLWMDPVRKEPLDDVPDDVESRRLAIGDLFDAPELWEAGYRCVPFKDEPTK